MTENTVTLATLDHGMVTITEPEWCRGHQDHVPVHQVDLTHYGREEHLLFHGRPLWTVLLGQGPFSSLAKYQRVGLHVEQGDLSETLDPAGLDQLAAALVEHAAILRHRARELAVLLGGDR